MDCRAGGQRQQAARGQHEEADDRSDMQARYRQQMREAGIAHRLRRIFRHAVLIARDQGRDNAALRTANPRLHMRCQPVPQPVQPRLEAVRSAGCQHPRVCQGHGQWRRCP